ncbi:glucose 1-dehydrogenase [Lutibaculum baratangense]|uniref:Glucose 1-dehydrogenase n=1 Tax=Lutibaculum baratangense AMV1 TaxID=631454 RepID=V4QXZ3_9HYPH|nr:glucose 1-dehydrogenase [Lutibaculum baratangense]ESR24622.1 Glucose 1-dehydrogenase [Lutibaculum baratangense AMV1]
MSVKRHGLLAGQAALVTGASSGIGAGIAKALAGEGAVVGVNYRSDRASAEDVVAAIAEAGGEAFEIEADVTEEDGVEEMMRTFLDRAGRLDVMVPNAGIQKDASIDEMTLDHWKSVLDVNLTGQFLCARAAIAQFDTQPGPATSASVGKIICMSSVHQDIPCAGRVNYAASKGGIDMMMRSLAQEVAHRRIRINSIAPGAIKTPINEEAWQTEEAERQLLELIPYGRVGVVEDVARAAVWLASDLSDYVVGTTLYVDGGMSLYPGFRDNG